MGYELRPTGGSLASAPEVHRLLSQEFAYVTSDAAEGLEAARARARWIEQASARVFLGAHKQGLETAERLRTLPLGEALAIRFGDDATTTLKFVVIPGDTIKFGFASGDEHAAAKPMVERAARVLGCEVVLI